MSMDNASAVNWIQSDHPRSRITVEDILDALIARTSRALQPGAGSTAEVTAQVQTLVQLAQQLKDAVGKVRQLDPTLLTDNPNAATPP